jgi:hypothetical protein
VLQASAAVQGFVAARAGETATVVAAIAPTQQNARRRTIRDTLAREIAMRGDSPIYFEAWINTVPDVFGVSIRDRRSVMCSYVEETGRLPESAGM